MWCIQNFASLSLNNFPLAAQETNLSNANCQVIGFSLNHVPSGPAYWQFSISFLPVASARSCSPVAATFSSPHISSLTNTAGLLPSLSTLPHFHSFLLLTQVQPRGLAELCLGLFLHFLLYLVHGPIYSCIFFLLLLRFMHFLCHSMLQASHVERPAFPQIPLSLPVST